MKKTIVILLALLTILLVFTGCNRDSRGHIIEDYWYGEVSGKLNFELRSKPTRDFGNTMLEIEKWKYGHSFETNRCEWILIETYYVAPEAVVIIEYSDRQKEGTTVTKCSYCSGLN